MNLNFDNLTDEEIEAMIHEVGMVNELGPYDFDRAMGFIDEGNYKGFLKFIRLETRHRKNQKGN